MSGPEETVERTVRMTPIENAARMEAELQEHGVLCGVTLFAALRAAFMAGYGFALVEREGAMAKLPRFRGVRLVSDGTARGTKLFDAEGKPMNLDRARSISWRCVAGQAPVVQVDYYAHGQEVDLNCDTFGNGRGEAEEALGAREGVTYG